MMIVERKNTRGRIEIMASILLHCQEGIKKTHVMAKANVGYEQICYYLPSLIGTGLLTQDIDDGFVVYRTTDIGRNFLKSYFDIMRLLVNDKYSGSCQKDDIEQNGTLISIFEEIEV